VTERAGTEVEIAPSSERELDQLFGLALSAFGDLPGWDGDRVLAALTRDTVFVARERRQPAGYVALRTESPEATIIEQLLVAPGHERRGIGRQLLAHAEGYAIAEQMETLRVVVENDNEPARRFYRRAGFVPVSSEVFELVLPRVR
jgi:ribosomal protein S18 acetylase RimI-like enzyme